MENDWDDTLRDYPYDWVVPAELGGDIATDIIVIQLSDPVMTVWLLLGLLAGTE